MFISGQHICTNHICTWRGDTHTAVDLVNALAANLDLSTLDESVTKLGNILSSALIRRDGDLEPESVEQISVSHSGRHNTLYIRKSSLNRP